MVEYYFDKVTVVGSNPTQRISNYDQYVIFVLFS